MKNSARKNEKSAARGGETSFATPRRAFFIFSHAVLRAEPQLTERLKEVKINTKRKNEVLFLDEGEGFIGDWVKEYGILGIPLGFAIILIIAIVSITGSKKKK